MTQIFLLYDDDWNGDCCLVAAYRSEQAAVTARDLRNARRRDRVHADLPNCDKWRIDAEPWLWRTATVKPATLLEDAE